MNIPVKTMFRGESLPLPTYANPSDTGMDLRADLAGSLLPGQSILVPTGISVALPMGWELQVRPRSGLAIKYGVTVLNTPGTIDAGYRNEIGVILINHGTGVFRWERGDRIAQLVLGPVYPVEWDRVETLPDSDRGLGGFGSSGVK